MILCDAGPLVALIDTADSRHLDCKKVLPQIDYLVTTWPCFTEAMYLVGRRFGFKPQQDLWNLIAIGAVVLHEATAEERMRMQALMEQYQNVPMDLGDASIVAAAESLGETRVFTLDSDFGIYRLNNTTAFEILP